MIPVLPFEVKFKKSYLFENHSAVRALNVFKQTVVKPELYQNEQ